MINESPEKKREMSMRKNRLVFDKITSKALFAVTVFLCLILFTIVFALYYKSRPLLAAYPLARLIFSTAWNPLRHAFGFFPFIMGTLWVTGVALIIAIPPCLLTAVYLSEYAHQKTREWTAPLVDLLAGIPSVVYGLWGVLVVVPLIKNIVAPRFGAYSTGYSALAGGIVLAIMIFPVIIHVSGEVLRAVPYQVREVSLALGATKWQTIKCVVMRKALPGIIAAIVLGLSRAFGETMAVLMVAGNVPKAPSSVFSPAYPLPALIANNYGEMLSIPLYDSALLFASLVLLVVVLFFNILSRAILVRVERRLK